MPRLRILHLSDLHLSKNFSTNRKHLGMAVYEPPILDMVAKIAYEWQEEIEAILISGDIADTGDDADLRRAIEFFDSPPIAIASYPWLNSKSRPTLRAFKKPIVLVPGNHDRYKWGRLFCMPGGGAFEGYFANYWQGGIGGIQTTLLPNNARVPKLAILSADFTLERRKDSSVIAGHWGQGKIYNRRLGQLMNETAAIGRAYPTCAVLWMLHFAPHYERHHSLEKQMQLMDADDLIAAADKLGVKYMFCGHTHKMSRYQTSTANANNIWIHCAGTSTCVKSGNDTSIHVCDLEIEHGRIRNIQSLDYIWDNKQKIFITH